VAGRASPTPQAGPCNLRRRREQDDERYADDELHKEDRGELNRLRVDLDPERQGCDWMKDVVVFVLHKYLETDEEDPEWQDEQKPLKVYERERDVSRTRGR